MTSPAVVIAPETPVGEIARLMLERHFRALPVVDATGELVGIVSDADLMAKHAEPHFPLYLQFLEARIYLESPKPVERELQKAAARVARELMTEQVETIEAEADVTEAATRLFRGGYSTLPVVDHGRLVGVVTRADILRLLVLEESGRLER